MQLTNYFHVNEHYSLTFQKKSAILIDGKEVKP